MFTLIISGCFRWSGHRPDSGNMGTVSPVQEPGTGADPFGFPADSADPGVAFHDNLGHIREMATTLRQQTSRFAGHGHRLAGFGTGGGIVFFNAVTSPRHTVTVPSAADSSG